MSYYFWFCKWEFRLEGKIVQVWQEVCGRAKCWAWFYLALLTLDVVEKCFALQWTMPQGQRAKSKEGNYICVPMGMEARSNVIGWSPRFQRQLQSGGHLSCGRKKASLSETRGKVRPKSSICPHVGSRRWRRGLLESKQRPGEGNIGDAYAERISRSHQMLWELRYDGETRSSGI